MEQIGVDGADGGWAGGMERWEAGGRLNSPLGLFGLTMSPRSANHRSKYAFQVALSMGPIVSVVDL